MQWWRPLILYTQREKSHTHTKRELSAPGVLFSGSASAYFRRWIWISLSGERVKIWKLKIVGSLSVYWSCWNCAHAVRHVGNAHVNFDLNIYEFSTKCNKYKIIILNLCCCFPIYSTFGPHQINSPVKFTSIDKTLVFFFTNSYQTETKLKVVFLKLNFLPAWLSPRNAIPE